jgi:predicted RecA/RadA family phage recombinase
MATNYVQDGATVTVVAPTGGYTAGQVVGLPTQDASGKMIGIVESTVAATETAVLLTEGVFTVTKTIGVGEDWFVGDDVYVTATGAFTETATTNAYGGVVWAAAGTGAATGQVRINFGGDPR